MTSPSLQGRRTTTTAPGGDFAIQLLPAGEYEVTVSLEGLGPQTLAVKISAAQQTKIDVDLGGLTTEETVTVTALADTVATNSELSTTLTKALIETLPTRRTIQDTILLAPGVNGAGPGRTDANPVISIAGSQTYENLFMVDGVAVNENLRGQALNLYVEDAVQETTVSVSGISAEYGRFAGGVVNVLTKSGGNDFHGSLRQVLSNDRWTQPTPITVSRVDKLNDRYEATLGGRILRDRLWFFATGRDFTTESSGQTAVTRTAYPTSTSESRAQAKLTLAATDTQRLIANYSKIDRAEAGNSFLTVLDRASLVNRELPQELWSANYNGVFGSSFFATAQYSKRDFSFVNAGATSRDRIGGTLMLDANTFFRYHAPTFCGVCGNEERNNEDILLKGSWFVSAERTGSHEVAIGVDRFNDIRKADNHQSGSDFRVFTSDTVIRDGQVYGVVLTPSDPDDINSTATSFFVYNPILIASKGTDFRTTGVYANDRWRVSDNLSLNLGVRYDKNDGVDSNDATVAKDSRLSPRLGLSWDVKGDGRWVVNASAADYVTAIANTIADSSSAAGNPATLAFNYGGPSINDDPNGPLVSNDEVLRRMFAWLDSVGGVNARPPVLDPAVSSVPGLTTFIRGSLRSPFTREYSLGLGMQLGTRGLARFDVVRRESSDFYSAQTDTTTGLATTPTGPQARTFIINVDDDRLERTYTGLLMQLRYRFGDRVNLGGSYTLSRTYGNVVGETSGSGPVTSGVTQYPEYKQARWNSPKGDLSTDQRHRLALYATANLLEAQRHRLTMGAVQRYESGVPYGAVGAVDSRSAVTNPGYPARPSSVTYFYTARDAFHTPAIYPFDLSLNYSFNLKLRSTDVELFVSPQVINVFNQQRQIDADTTVLDATNTAGLSRFNPFTQTPVEGVNWRKGRNFGGPVNTDDYQTPRTFRLSLGVRF